MGVKTGIQWCDSTVNPTTGCDGCELWEFAVGGPCYAGNYHEIRMAKALTGLYAADFTEVREAPGRMAKAAAWSDLTGTKRPGKPWLDGMPRVVFIGDMGDVFSSGISFEYLKNEVIDNVTSPRGRRHIWMLLTKRPLKMSGFADWLFHQRGIPWPANLWAGTSVTSAASLGRIDGLLKVPARFRFLSAEPLIEGVDLGRWVHRFEAARDDAGRDLGYSSGGSNLDLLIVGGESGTTARPFDLAWARSLIRLCEASDVACFVKQLGARPYDSDAMGEVPGALDVVNYDQATSPEGLDLMREILEASVVRLKDRHGGDWYEWEPGLRVRQMPDYLWEGD